jgi:hypothetical protein
LAWSQSAVANQLLLSLFACNQVRTKLAAMAVIPDTSTAVDVPDEDNAWFLGKLNVAEVWSRLRNKPHQTFAVVKTGKRKGKK